MITQWKRGATFTPVVTYTAADGELPSLLGATVTSQLRQNTDLVADLQVSLANDGMSFTLDAGDTSGWPLGPLHWDIRIEFGGTVIYSNTVDISVIPAVTQP